MPLKLNINIPKINIPKPPPIRIPPIKNIVKQIPLISTPLRIPPIKVPVKIDINIAGLPPLHINQPVIRIPPLKIPKPPPVPKPKIDMPALKQATGIIAGIISIHPIGRGLVMGITGIADAASGGKASQFINNGNKTNGTLSMIPGGFLAQQIANDASKGKSGDALNKYIPDPKKMIISNVTSVGKTLVTDPKNTLNTTKSVLKDNVKTLKKNESVKFFSDVVVKPTIGGVVAGVLKEPVKEVSTLEKKYTPPVIALKQNDEIKSTLQTSSIKPVVPLPVLSPQPLPTVKTELKTTLGTLKKDKQTDTDYTIPIALGLGVITIILFL